MTIPQNEEFVTDVRRAAGWLHKPTILTSGPQLASGETFARIVQQAALWLTPKVVQAYAPDRFDDVPEALRTSLQRNVERFRAVAQKVPARGEVSKEDYEEGREALEEVVSVTGQVVRAEWKSAVETVVADVELWCREKTWPSRRVDKEMDESLLGKYSLPQLEFYADQHLYVLDPLARFVPGGKGAFDLSIQPSFFVTGIYRGFDNLWYIDLDVEQGARNAIKTPLDKNSFLQAVTELRALL